MSRSPNRNPIALQAALVLLTVATSLLLAVKCGLHPVWSYLLAINLTTFIAYGYDKWAAPREGKRLPERTLHLFAAVGGTPAALAGQIILHHKSRKRSFQIRFWLIVVAQLILLGAWLCWWSSGHSRAKYSASSDSSVFESSSYSA